MELIPRFQRGSRIDSPSVAPPMCAVPGSAMDRLFALQLLRKQVVDSSLSTAMDAMQQRIDQQQKLNQVLANLSTRIDGAGNVALTAADIALFREAGFQMRDGDLVAPDHWDSAHGRYTTSEALIVRANELWTPGSPIYRQGSGPREEFDGKYVVLKDKIAAFKDALTQHVSSLSGTNEIQMMSLQRLMNQANESMQAATTQAKSDHDTKMAIIRNFA